MRRIREFFALDDDWDRPGRGLCRRDVLLALGVGVLSLLVLELIRPLGTLEAVTAPIWVQWLVVIASALPLLTRRLWPLASLIAASVGFFALGTWEPTLSGLLSVLVCYFIVVLGGVAWARNRREMLLVVSATLLLMLLWLVWGFAVGNALSDYPTEYQDDSVVPVWFAAVGLTFVINALYFGGAVLGGQVLWRNARQRIELERQAATIEEQSVELREQAVTEERLRIARELHDVVAHHISAMGVQAAAARRVMDRDPEQAGSALEQIEGSSREAVGQMRALLGTLRSGQSAGLTTPQPGLAQLGELVAVHDDGPLEVSLDVIEDAPGQRDRVPVPVGQSVYRVVQEALTNVTRHSTAQRARVVLRVTRARVEVEVTDDGRARGGTEGSSLGHLGIEERATLHGGGAEIGPRATDGYRVRWWAPLSDEGDRHE